MNKKGLSLFELLGVLVIMGIILSISATVISSYIRANQRIAISVQANEEGNLLSRRVETELEELNPNTYETCAGSNCYILIKEYEYIINEDTQGIELNVLSIPTEYKIQILNQQLLINDEVYDFEGFTLADTSQLELTEDQLNRSIKLNIVLESSQGDLYEFLASYSFRESVIPNA